MERQVRVYLGTRAECDDAGRLARANKITREQRALQSKLLITQKYVYLGGELAYRRHFEVQ